MEGLPQTDLVNRMKGNQTTNRWDVVVSYDEDKTNELLQADSTKPEGILQIEPFTKEVDFWIIFRTTGKGKEEIAAGTQLRLIVSLFNCAGQRIESNGGTTFVPDSKNGFIEGATKDYNIPLDPGNGRGNGICLVFRNVEARVIPTDTIMKNLVAPIETGITEHFADAKEIYYYLTGVSKYTPSAVNKVLEPVAFNFSTTTPDNDLRIPGVLTTWTSVKGGEGGGQQPSGQKPLFFRRDGQTRCPIPKGSSASVIISNYTMANCFFIPNLLRIFKNVKQKDNTGEIASEGDMQAENIYVEALKTKHAPDGNNMIRRPVNGATTGTPAFADSKPTLSGGNVTLTFTWNAVGSWSVGAAAHPNLLQLDFKGDNEYTTIQTADKPTFWLDWVGASTGYPNFYKDIHAPKPDIDLSMDALDYFLTTNVFFPGREIFKAHSPVANADKSTGLAVPRDLILTGDVATE
ncbi:hypothetical protein AARAC_004691 [Aspergillus arachidicola]|uniref:Uncharacterized protein n=1 Tax=Aspergillus arachidicola TaxID=656916 RepID=A0A2G7G0Y1_9EURO|nr:hypothetical protein AARAC_004691 [Aspergillus arachidicola]